MIDVFLQTLPFFVLVGIGYGAGRAGVFSAAATDHLTRFVFYFALSALLFRFSATLSVGEIFDPRFVAAYLLASIGLYLVAMAVALMRRRPMVEAAMEAQCAVIGNTGFLGVPLLVALLGERAAGPVLMVLTIDLVVFASLITLLVTWARAGRLAPDLPGRLMRGLLANPMVVAVALGLGWSATGLTLPGPVDDTLALLAAAATPGALFAIGASLATKAAERLTVAGWLAFAKLVLHPGAVALTALWIFAVEPGAAGVMIAAAALPVAGNVYMLAQHYGVAPQRVSASILLSTAAALVTVPVVIALVVGL